MSVYQVDIRQQLDLVNDDLTGLGDIERLQLIFTRHVKSVSFRDLKIVQHHLCYGSIPMKGVASRKLLLCRQGSGDRCVTFVLWIPGVGYFFPFGFVLRIYGQRKHKNR